MTIMHNAAVIVCSDRAHLGTYADHSGPAARSWLEAHGFQVKGPVVIPDEAAPLGEAIGQCIQDGAELVVVSGGTGLGPRDLTPQVLDRLADYPVPGFGELLRRESLKYSLNAYLSRCGAWVKDKVLILALPGSPKAVAEQLGIAADLLPHALKSLKGECDHRRRTPDA